MAAKSAGNAGLQSNSERPSVQLEGNNASATQEAPAGNHPNVQDAISGDRRRKVAEAAYYRAERRGFAPGHEESDRLAAEREIDGWHGSIRVEELNKCLRNELSAIETYRQALESNRAQYGQDAKFEQLEIVTLQSNG